MVARYPWRTQPTPPTPTRLSGTQCHSSATRSRLHLRHRPGGLPGYPEPLQRLTPLRRVRVRSFIDPSPELVDLPRRAPSTRLAPLAALGRASRLASFWRAWSGFAPRCPDTPQTHTERRSGPGLQALRNRGSCQFGNRNGFHPKESPSGQHRVSIAAYNLPIDQRRLLPSCATLLFVDRWGQCGRIGRELPR